MKNSTAEKISELIKRYPALEICRADLILAVEKICTGFRAGNKLLICGNGGSAADSLHIVGELMKGFIQPRKIEDFDKNFVEAAEKLFPDDINYFKKNLQCALPAISLVGETALNTAVANDNAADLIFAQQVLGLGKRGDILLAISTSGNSANVLYAAKVAKVLGLEIISLTGRSGGKLKNISDVTICAPADSAYTVQEFHLPIYHALCIAAENEFFG
ncbi:MAG: SIS domain-containing protein [Selenomonadaceae bacterium]|nr:SIS domain-containing protein [Selenomonadaceae bacterium]